MSLYIQVINHDCLDDEHVALLPCPVEDKPVATACQNTKKYSAQHMTEKQTNKSLSTRRIRRNISFHFHSISQGIMLNHDSNTRKLSVLELLQVFRSIICFRSSKGRDSGREGFTSCILNCLNSSGYPAYVVFEYIWPASTLNTDMADDRKE